MAFNDTVNVQDVLIAQLEDCTPPPEAPTVQPLPTPPESSPATRAAEATIEQTGAGPPPKA